VLEGQTCNACHDDGGVATAAGPALTGVGAKISVEQMHDLLLHPSEKMTSGGMPTVDLSAEDLSALIA
jgi:mono/diheme cytochrome c family protein